MAKENLPKSQKTGKNGIRENYFFPKFQIVIYISTSCKKMLRSLRG